MFGAVVPVEVAVAMETTAGPLRCTVDARRTPRTAALVLGLARGVAAFRDARTGQATRRPFYDGLTFHRRIADVLVQGGCPLGDGTGTPGYRIPLELRPDDAARLATPGVMFMATYTPPPGRRDPSPPLPGHIVGSQFAVGLRSMVHLAGRTTVLGRCDGLGVLRALAATPRGEAAPRILRVR